MATTKIEWADAVWNPITGCSPISEGCDHCYARRMANRLKGRCGYPSDDPFRVTFHPERLKEPTIWRKPRRIFVCSMGDLFHAMVLEEWIAAVMLVASICSHHTFIILTKRPEQMKQWFDKHPFWHTKWPLPNMWLGVTAENQQRADERIPILLQIPAAVRFVSVEPMLGTVDIKKHLSAICPICGGMNWNNYGPLGMVCCRCDAAYGRRLSWAICGGETGPGARPMHPDWVRSLRDQCVAAGVPFFFKGWGEWLHNSAIELAQEDHVESGDLHRDIEGNYFKLRRHKKGSGPDTRGWLTYSDSDKINDGAMVRVGKKAAGRLLAGREWNEVPR